MSQKNLTLSRRNFLKRSAITISSFPILAQINNFEVALAQAGGSQAVDPNSPVALALGYVHDATKADTVKFPKRKGPDGEKQFCNNCMFYPQGGLKADGQTGEWGKCTIFPQGLVNAKGWCNSWAAKPA